MSTAKLLSKLGYSFIATSGTAELLKNEGIEVKEVRKLKEGEPNILQVIKNREVDLVINTPTKGNDSHRDGFVIRRTAIESNVEVITSIDTAKALVEVTKEMSSRKDLKEIKVYPLNLIQRD